MMLDSDRYKDSVEDYKENWYAMDKVLYDLCQTYPAHNVFAGVAAKVCIIGRAYATQIERHVSSDGTQGESIMKVIEHLCANAAKVDGWVSELKGLCELKTEQAWVKIASIHGRFVNLLCEITRDRMHATSFASKYLHFHCPLVPIFDTVADAALTKHNHWNKSMSRFSACADAHADKTYVWYLARLWPLYQEIADTKLPLSGRFLDCTSPIGWSCRVRLADHSPVSIRSHEIVREVGPTGSAHSKRARTPVPQESNKLCVHPCPICGNNWPTKPASCLGGFVVQSPRPLWRNKIAAVRMMREAGSPCPPW